MEQKNNALVASANVAEQVLYDYLETLTDKLTAPQRKQFIAVAQAFNLNPFKREIYAVYYNGKLSIITGYEVYLKRAAMCPQYDGFETNFGTSNNQVYCECNVYRKDLSHATKSIVWMSEYKQEFGLWKSKPRMMLEKVAIATAFRRAFPVEFGGMPYTRDELPDEMTGAEQLQKKGLQEVNLETPTAAPVVNKQQKFQSMLIDMNKENPEAFALLKEQMLANGWKSSSEVPVEKYTEIEQWFNIAKMGGKK